jgi:hypothetical protein
MHHAAEALGGHNEMGVEGKGGRVFEVGEASGLVQKDPIDLDLDGYGEVCPFEDMGVPELLLALIVHAKRIQGGHENEDPLVKVVDVVLFDTTVLFDVAHEFLESGKGGGRDDGRKPTKDSKHGHHFYLGSRG